ncbi:hypothetical protein BJF79_31250 [Actinomadura sp. CNU-125]|uniref:sensor histidine kinase n=1 Tax=Actinomadura sp. CNU-125 TaxID=1904961 RepID=UPI0009622446|nr:ATP-binding protein [Actinomadura sp. CNU-125]OLT36354.1 hypothetical protein BJF79_31250 [Actinomadura sp. CNU-125]
MGNPADAVAVSAQRVDVHPHIGRMVVLLPGPCDADSLFWHWQRPYSDRQWMGLHWFQPFHPATEPDRAADVIAAAIDADVRAHARSAHVPTERSDAEFEREVLARMGRPLHLLVYRILESLDSVERQVEDTVLLHELFKIDHLTTRTLRGLERLAVLGGATARQVNAPLKLATAMRQAVAQIEHYPRVRVKVPPAQVDADLPGYAGPEITLLLAELVENAAKFSPPDTTVQMAAVPTPSGVSIEVADKGLPMSADTYATLNRLLATPDTVRLHDQIVAGPIGLLVASRLAQRHRVQVTLYPAEPHGTRAVVALPADLLLRQRPGAVAEPVSLSPSAPMGGGKTPGVVTDRHLAQRVAPLPSASFAPSSGQPVVPGEASAMRRSSVGTEASPSFDSGGKHPALPRRRRRSKAEYSADGVAADAAADPRSAASWSPRDHQQPNTGVRGPVAGLLADFAYASRLRAQGEVSADPEPANRSSFNGGLARSSDPSTAYLPD